MQRNQHFARQATVKFVKEPGNNLTSCDTWYKRVRIILLGSPDSWFPKQSIDSTESQHR